MPAVWGKGDIGDKQHIDYVVRVILLEDNNSPATGRRCNKLSLRYMQAASVSQVQIKWNEGLRVIGLADFCNRHTYRIYHFASRLTNRSMRSMASWIRSSEVAKQHRK